MLQRINCLLIFSFISWQAGAQIKVAPAPQPAPQPSRWATVTGLQITSLPGKRAKERCLSAGTESRAGS